MIRTATRPHPAPDTRSGARRLGRAVLSTSAAAALVAAGAAGADATGTDAGRGPSGPSPAVADVAEGSAGQGGRSTTGFARVATYDVPGGVAEIVAATDDGETLVYTDSGAEQVGVVDLGDPAAPTQVASVDVGGEPTSVAVRGRLALVAVDGPDDLAVVDLDAGAVVARLPLSGQPDSVALDPSGRYAAVVIENQRDEDLDEGRMPQDPPGFLVVVDAGTTTGAGGDDPAAWTTRRVDLTGLDGARFPTDPEPEFVDVDARGVAAVTLQENNAVALVDLASGQVTGSFSAGTSTHPADLADDGEISFTDTLSEARREPDAIAWTPQGNLVTANEGDYDVDLGPDEFVGGRGFTVFSPDGTELYDVGERFEVEGALRGQYPDSRSGQRGSEVEGVETATYGGSQFLFVGSERGSYVGVYRTDGEGGDAQPQFVQALPTATSPEGILALPQRDLLVVAGEVEGALSVYAGTASPSQGGPDPSSSVDVYATSLDGAFGALSGLSPAPGGRLYAVADDAFTPRVFTLDPAPFRAGTGPALVTDTVRVTRDGAPAPYDLEGVAQRAGGGWWVVSEGAVDDDETPEDERTPNLLVSVDPDGEVAQQIALPEAVDAARTGRGLEGVATSADGSQVYVVVQDAGSDDVVDGLRYAKVGRYDVGSGTWGFARYPLPAAPDGARVGLSEIAAVGDGTFAVVERDDLSGSRARLKQVWTVDLAGAAFAPAGGDLPVLAKKAARDLLGRGGRSGEVGRPESGPWRQEKLEGLARADDGTWYAVNDNDGAGESDLRAYSSLTGDAGSGASADVPQLVAQGLVPDSFGGVPVGGLSGITYDAARRVYYAISDDRGDLAPARFYTLRGVVGADGAPRARVVSSTTLTDPAGQPFAPGVTDTEGIALTPRGTLVITSEGDVKQLIPPFVREFGLDGRQLRDLPIPADLVPAPDGTSGVRDNLALEPATITPDGGGLTGTEGSLVQDGPVSTTTSGSTDRIIRYDPAGRPVAQHAYPLGPIPDAPVPADAFAVTGLVELAATSDDTAYALERSFSTGVGNAVSLYRVDLAGASDVTGRSLADGDDDVVPVSKELVLDLATLGITLDNLEGMTLGPVLPDGRRSLVLVADDNFSDAQVNQVIVLAL